MSNSMQDYCESRLRKLLVRDKQNNPSKVNNILRAEILYVLRNYLELKDNDVDINISITDKGLYKINIQAECRNIKAISYVE